jgi:aspartate/methionine/tyrosine aminotransferase
VEFLSLNFEDKWRLDVDKLAKMIRPDTKLISITLPNNPTGSIISLEDIEKIVALVEQNDFYLLLDETYRDMTFGDLLPIGATLHDRIISVASMSKSFGFSGIRTGWIRTKNKALMDTFFAAKEQIAICGPSLDEEIAYYILKRKDSYLEKYDKRIQERFAIVKKWMDENAFLEWVPPSGGVVCFPRIKKELDIDIDLFYTTLRDKYKTYVGPGHWFEMDRRFFRIGFGTPEIVNLRAALECVSKSLEEAKM